jgi:hypothetical protein
MDNIISDSQAFNIIYDFLKRKRILREYIEESYEFHKDDFDFNVMSPYGRDNTKEIIYNNIIGYRKNSSIHSSSLESIFISFSGSLEWANSRLGSDFWRKYLVVEWREYLVNKIGHDVYFENNQ